MCERNVVRPIVLLCFMLMLSSCSVFYKKFYSDPTVCFEAAQQHRPFDVVIVPGYPFTAEVINPMAEQRVAWAVYLYKHGYTRRLIFSGGAVHTGYVEAEAMRLYALHAGVPSDAIFIETKAEHTTENLYYSALLADSLGFKKKALASQPNQVSSMIHFNKKYKLKLSMLPIVSDTIKRYPLPNDQVDISTAAAENFVPLLKRRGRFKSTLGTIGYYVRKEFRTAKRKARREKKLMNK